MYINFELISLLCLPFLVSTGVKAGWNCLENSTSGEMNLAFVAKSGEDGLRRWNWRPGSVAPMRFHSTQT